MVHEKVDFRTFNVVMVDDNKDMMTAVGTYLRLVEHFSVTTVSSPYIAVELIKSYKRQELAVTLETLAGRASVKMAQDKVDGNIGEDDFDLYGVAEIIIPENKTLAQIYQEGILVIVSDAKMGGIDGFQLLNYAAKEIPATSRLLLSAEPGYIKQKALEELFAAGAIGYISKGMPDYESKLVETIRDIFDKKM
ncbi:hypothetical protein HZA96_04500 [Candidatus Woesearchaeota archaeon]|nr:hypothetical protein [Candidatus Woesearchaeota archaeon]